MSIFIPTGLDEVKKCQLCGQSILFVERREGGLWFPTDAIQDEETGSWGYQSQGSQREVALLHRCYGDPKDPTTVNGRRSEYMDLIRDIHEKFEALQRKNSVSPENGGYSEEYERLTDEYVKIREKFSGITER